MFSAGYKTRAKRSVTAFLLLFAFLMLPVGGAASHYCFDGQEPLVSVHFDNFSGHEDHTEEARHVDAEKRLLAENVVGKVFQFDPGIPVSTSIAEDTFEIARIVAVPELPTLDYVGPWLHSPPLRAPPHNS